MNVSCIVALVNMRLLLLELQSFENSLKGNQRSHPRFKPCLAVSGYFLKISAIAVRAAATASTEIAACKEIQEESRNVAKDENTTVTGACHYLHGNEITSDREALQSLHPRV